MELSDYTGNIYQMGYIDLTTFEYHIIFQKLNNGSFDIFQDIILFWSFADGKMSNSIWNLSGDQIIMLFEFQGVAILDDHIVIIETTYTIQFMIFCLMICQFLFINLLLQILKKFR